MSLIIFILILGILVLIHELGHFLAAKKVGILIEEFGFGFPPRVWSKRIGETLYSLNLLPIGGFVKLFGEEYQEIRKGSSRHLKKRTFVYKKPLQKALVILAGIIMNILLAVFIYYGLLGFNNFRSEPLLLLEKQNFFLAKQETRVTVARVVKNSPAAKAGIKSEDIVLNFTSASQLISFIKKNNNLPITLKLENIANGKISSVTVVPYFDKKLKRTIIGINLVDTVTLVYEKPLVKLFSGFIHSYNLAVYNLKSLGFLISTSVKEKNPAIATESLSGPIGIFSIINNITQTSGNKLTVNLLNLIALLSISLATINVFPFPALDGGRMIFVLYEWITKKRVNVTIERYVNAIGFCFLLVLAVIISINDILKFFK